MFNPLNLISKFIKTPNQKELDRLQKIVKQVNAYEEHVIKLEDKDFLSSMGVKVALQGHLPYMAGVKAVYEVMKALRSGTKPSELGGASQYSDFIGRVTREKEHDGWIDKYL